MPEGSVSDGRSGETLAVALSVSTVTVARHMQMLPRPSQTQTMEHLRPCGSEPGITAQQAFGSLRTFIQTQPP